MKAALWGHFTVALMSAAVGALIVALLAGDFGAGAKTANSHLSGVRVHTDIETWCQYLQGGSALTPRLDASGRHMCGEGKK
jgi:hypothetical protein